jgi:hypothetical protein
MTYLIVFLFTGLIVGAAAAPMMRQLGYSYGRFGTVGDTSMVVVSTLFFGLLLATVFGAIGAVTVATVEAVVIGIIVAVLTVALLAFFSVESAANVS